MQILVISPNGQNLQLAHQLQKEGHKVELFVANLNFRDALEGIVERASAWRPALKYADFVVVTDLDMLQLEPVLRDVSKTFIGTDKFSYDFEHDDVYFRDLMEASGIKTLELVESPAEVDLESYGLLVLREGEKPFFIRFKEQLSQISTIGCTILKVPLHAISVVVEGWWNGRDWITPFYMTYEESKFMNKGLGPTVPSMGATLTYVRRGKPLVEETLAKLTSYMKETTYRGPVALNCLVHDGKILAVSGHARLRAVVLEALAEGLFMPLSALLFETATGTARSMRLTEEYVLAVRASRPPWPYSSNSERDILINGLCDKALKHVSLSDVYLNGAYKTAGSDGQLFTVTARGETVNEARRRVYRTLSKLYVNDIQYRTDIGFKAEEAFTELRAQELF